MNFQALCDKKLVITEIFQSIQGEGHYSGFPCSFIRLTGCNLSCKWCDTEYAYDNGTSMDIDEIVTNVSEFNNRIVEITGGEPLLQENVYTLFDLLHQRGNHILLETNGSLLINQVPEYVHIIMDIKAPGSDGFDLNALKNLSYIKRTDEIKIVISNYEDFEWALETCSTNQLFNFFEKPIILQPAFRMLPEQELSRWILNSGKLFKLGVQLHKYIFGENVRGA